ncbi:MAG: ATP-binding protein, partial [Chloroflexota bacterium]
VTGWHGILKDHQPPRALLDLLLSSSASMVLAGEKLWQFRQQKATDRPILTYRFEKLAYRERLQVWKQFAGDAGAELPLVELANHFQFTPGQIRDAVYTARNIARWENQPLSKHHLLEASRSHSNQNLAELAKKVTITVGWEDLILPEDPLTQLKELTNQARNRPTVHDAWGFGRKLPGRGLSALFTGEPGTGKTMSAGIIAQDLGLDLYKVDLSSLVSKYIGETEKNLDRVFTEANTSNAVLFFDEADSIFGKRSEVKDSHDRYANLEISYLLQRVESYDGISILATNMRSNLDEAFTRRFDFITDFPFPDPGYREKIWQIHFPSDTPIADDIDIPLLATRFRLAGGNIRKIVLSAAFLAAQDGEPISMQHMLHAVKREYQKMGRLIEDELFN